MGSPCKGVIEGSVSVAEDFKPVTAVVMMIDGEGATRYRWLTDDIIKAIGHLDCIKAEMIERYISLNPAGPID